MSDDSKSIIRAAMEGSGGGAETAIGDTNDVGTVETTTPEPVEAAQEGANEVVEGQEPPVVEGESAVKPPAIVEPKDEFAEEHGIKPKRADQKENYIPYTRVKGIAENTARKTLATALGVEIPKDKPLAEFLTEHSTTRTAREAEFNEYKSEVESQRHVGQIMESNPQQFLDMLVETFPAYAELIGKGAAVPAVDPDEPDFDIEVALSDGTKARSYSPEGWKKRAAWERAQAVKEMQTNLDKRLKPFDDETKQRKEAEETQASMKRDVDYARENLAGLKENEPAIIAIMKEDRLAREAKGLPALDMRTRIHQGWAKFMSQKHKTSEAEIEERIKKQLREAPVSTSTVSGVPVPRKDESKDESSKDIIRKTMFAR